MLFCAFEAAEAEVAAYLATMLFLLIFCCWPCSVVATASEAVEAAAAGGLLGFFEVIVMASNDSRDECLLLGVAFNVIVSLAVWNGQKEKLIGVIFDPVLLAAFF